MVYNFSISNLILLQLGYEFHQMFGPDYTCLVSGSEFKKIRFYISPDRGFLLMVEFIEVLHISKYDVLLVDDSWRNLFNSTGHFPQIGLQIEKTTR